MTHPYSFTANEADSTPTAVKVAEVFLTAGHAFQKLGDLALKLNQPISENTNETKWSEKEVDRLKEALSRFANDLENISESVQGRIVQKIKTDIKRKTMIGGTMTDNRVPLNTSSYSTPTSGATAMNRAGNSSGFGGTYGTSAYASGGQQAATSSASTSLVDGMSFANSHQQEMTGARLMDIKQEEYGNSPPTLNMQGIPRPTSMGNLSSLKRTANPMYSVGGHATMMQRGGYMSAGGGMPPYKKSAFGGTTLRPIRTINATVNSSPGGGHSIQLARAGAIPSQQHRSQYTQQQQLNRAISNQQQQQQHSGAAAGGGVVELEGTPEKSPNRDSSSPIAQQL